MSIQRLENVKGIPTWVKTPYESLKQAREANPQDPPNFFRCGRTAAEHTPVDAWNKGGGWNSAGSEAPMMRKWALETFPKK